MSGIDADRCVAWAEGPDDDDDTFPYALSEMCDDPEYRYQFLVKEVGLPEAEAGEKAATLEAFNAAYDAWIKSEFQRMGVLKVAWGSPWAGCE